MDSFRHRPHKWGDPPAGQGRGRVCKSCGLREAQADPDNDCKGVQHGEPVGDERDYEPIT